MQFVAGPESFPVPEMDGDHGVTRDLEQLFSFAGLPLSFVFGFPILLNFLLPTSIFSIALLFAIVLLEGRTGDHKMFFSHSYKQAPFSKIIFE